jgi:hypothetical protein
MKPPRSIDKEKLWGSLLEGIDNKLSEGFQKPIILLDFYGDEKDIPQPNDGYVRWVAVPKPPRVSGSVRR